MGEGNNQAQGTKGVWEIQIKIMELFIANAKTYTQLSMTDFR